MASLVQSVGQRGVNRDSDVRTVQALLNAHAAVLALTPLEVNGQADARTIEAIRLFQTRVARLSTADGRVDPGGNTWLALSAAVVGSPAVATPGLSGAAWWQANQARFPNSAAVADLEPPFAAKVTAFISALQTGGATVKVSATRRNRVRAYLMHYSWRVAHGSIAAADVPAEPGCAIVWNHGDEAASRRAAQEMVDLFAIVFQPSLTSRHILGLAIDMTIAWAGSIRVRDATGRDVPLSSPANEANTVLHGIGASYGVLKLLSDPPHWSDNGH